MLYKNLLVATSILISTQIYAEQSWFDSALEYLGLGSEEQQAPAAKPESTSTTSAAISTADVLSLTQMVTQRLGVSPEQAQGGLGSLFNLAQSTMAAADFAQLSTAVPEMNSLLKAAPAISESAKGVSSLMGNLGKYANVAQGAATAYAQFKTLGIGTEQIPQYVDITNEFLEGQGGKDTKALFMSGVAALLSAP